MPEHDPDRIALKELSRRSDRKGLSQLAAHLAVLAVTGALVLAADGWLLAPALLCHGLVLTFLFAPLHESIHRTAFRSRRLNDATAWLCGLILLLPPEYFRLFHLCHHRHTQDPARDPELAGGPIEGRGGYLLHVSGLPYWRERAVTTLRHAAGRIGESFIPARLKGRIRREARAILAVYALLLAASLAANSAALLWLWVLPALLGQPFLRLYLLAEHNGCPRVADMMANSRTTLTTPLVERLCWHMNRHTVHHAYPAVPFHALAAADALLAPRIRERSPGYRRVHVDIWKRLGR